MTESIQKQNLTFESRKFNVEMEGEITDPAENRSVIFEKKLVTITDPTKTIAVIEVTHKSSEIDYRPEVGNRSVIDIKYLTVVEAAELENVTLKTVRNRCTSGAYKSALKQEINGVETWLIPITSLPASAQKAHAKKFALAAIEKTGAKDVMLSPPPLAHDEYAQLWERFERKGRNFKTKAQESLDTLLAYLELRNTGLSVSYAEQAMRQSHGVSRATLYRDFNMTKHHPREHWLPLLCPNHRGGRERAEFTPDAYEFIRALKMKSPSTNLRVLIREAQKAGEGKGWVLPSEDTIAKRLKEEPAWMYDGAKALERGFPTVERDYASLTVNQLWESDGRKADVWCRWPDGTVNRPFAIAIRDVRTRKVLGIRLCHAPDAEAVLGVFGSALSRTMAIPDKFSLDNGREYANKAFTGQQKTRYRFKHNVDEATGILTALGVTVKWSKPGQGRDKPIESWWRNIAERVDKHPIFSGAYCGNTPSNKPEDFNVKNAVLVETYAAKLIKEIEAFGKEPHRGDGMNHKTPDALYEELIQSKQSRIPNASQIRRCKMGVVALKLDAKDSSFRFKMKGYALPMKYWAVELSDLPLSERDGMFNVHYEWGEPNAPVSVYRGDVFICDAKPMGRIDFLESSDGENVKAHMAHKGEFMKTRRQAISAAKNKGTAIVPDANSQMSLPPITFSTGEHIIAPSTKPKALAAPVSAVRQVEGEPFMEEHVATGQRLTRVDKVRLADSQATVEDAEAATKKKLELEELERRRKALEEERLADLRKAG